MPNRKRSRKFGTFAAMIEKRIAPRHRVLKHGSLTFSGGGGGGIDCTVRNK
jgi:hypothetical protein